MCSYIKTNILTKYYIRNARIEKIIMDLLTFWLTLNHQRKLFSTKKNVTEKESCVMSKFCSYSTEMFLHLQWPDSFLDISYLVIERYSIIFIVRKISIICYIF